MVTTNETSLLRPALLAILILAVFKLFGAYFGVRLLLGNQSVPSSGGFGSLLAEHRVVVGVILLVAYGSQFVFCLLLRRGLRQRRHWAKVAGYVYAAWHVVGLLAMPFLGVVALLNGVLGGVALYGVRRADRAGVFLQVAVV